MKDNSNKLIRCDWRLKKYKTTTTTTTTTVYASLPSTLLLHELTKRRRC